MDAIGGSHKCPEGKLVVLRLWARRSFLQPPARLDFWILCVRACVPKCQPISCPTPISWTWVCRVHRNTRPQNPFVLEVPLNRNVRSVNCRGEHRLLITRRPSCASLVCYRGILIIVSIRIDGGNFAGGPPAKMN